MANLSTDVLDDFENRKELTPADAYQLMNPEKTPLTNLLNAASHIRDKEKGLIISYSRKVFIPLTNMCRNKCGYCEFRKDSEDPRAKIMTPQEVLKIAEEGKKLKCKEALFTFGEKPEEKYSCIRAHLRQLGHDNIIDYLCEMCDLVVSKTGLLPHSNPGILTRHELTLLKERNASIGLMLENSSDRLTQKGGPHEYSPGKNPQHRLKTIKQAGELKIPFTTGLLIGIGETAKERVNSLYEILNLHKEYGHIQEVIIQNFCPKPNTSMEHKKEPSLMEILRTIAVARLIFQGGTNIQTPPNLNPHRFHFIIKAGINDWGGVSPLTRDFVNPNKPWPIITELQQATAIAGYQFKERLPLYPEYITQKQDFIPQSLKTFILSLVNQRGYVKEEINGV